MSKAVCDRKENGFLTDFRVHYIVGHKLIVLWRLGDQLIFAKRGQRPAFLRVLAFLFSPQKNKKELGEM
ncbi:hypothetical protein P4479_12690 [Brevibacillus agri]|uniref:hypothetical protein n=1 Tax=Brevibacillus agri TaxID=51101 RepID=UPI002E222B59|nr:hypothetical protein [Brevibacillus agri]